VAVPAIVTDNKPVEHQPGIVATWAVSSGKVGAGDTNDPFIRPYRVKMAHDHDPLDITRVSCLAGDQPTILSTSPIIAAEN
jgi:hypothetical protein